MIFFYLYKTTLLEFLRPKRILIWVLISLLLAGASFLYMHFDSSAMQSETYGRVSDYFVYRLIPLVAAVYSIAVVSQEVSQRTIVYLVTRPIPRWILYLARVAASVTATAIVSIIAIFAVSSAINGINHVFTPGVAGDLIGVTIGACAYVSFFTLLSLWINKAMVAILLYAFGLETMAANMPGDMGLLSIKNYLTIIADKPPLNTGNKLTDIVASQSALAEMSKGTALPIMVIVTVVCLTVGAWWFSKYEYIPREDAE
jgi:ABC-2 type transport system permease protein